MGPREITYFAQLVPAVCLINDMSNANSLPLLATRLSWSPPPPEVTDLLFIIVFYLFIIKYYVADPYLVIISLRSYFLGTKCKCALFDLCKSEFVNNYDINTNTFQVCYMQ